jgi:hypothetical protein
MHRGRGCERESWVCFERGLVLAGSALAYDAYDPNNCNGVDWDDKRALIVAKVTAQPRVNFIKCPYDDDFKAEGRPAASVQGFHRLA